METTGTWEERGSVWKDVANGWSLPGEAACQRRQEQHNALLQDISGRGTQGNLWCCHEPQKAARSAMVRVSLGKDQLLQRVPATDAAGGAVAQPSAWNQG